MVQKTYFKTKDYCKVKFSFKTDSAKKVEIRGLNSDWQCAIVMNKKKDGTFSCDVSLPKNTQHEFKYLVDEAEWMTEPEADSQNINEYGGVNSVLIV